MAYLRSAERCCEEGVGRQIPRAEAEMVRAAFYRKRKRDRYRASRRCPQTIIRRMALGWNARVGGLGNTFQAPDLQTGCERIRALRALALVHPRSGEMAVDLFKMIKPHNQPVQLGAWLRFGYATLKL